MLYSDWEKDLLGPEPSTKMLFLLLTAIMVLTTLSALGVLYGNLAAGNMQGAFASFIVAAIAFVLALVFFWLWKKK